MSSARSNESNNVNYSYLVELIDNTYWKSTEEDLKILYYSSSFEYIGETYRWLRWQSVTLNNAPNGWLTVSKSDCRQTRSGHQIDLQTHFSPPPPLHQLVVARQVVGSFTCLSTGLFSHWTPHEISYLTEVEEEGIQITLPST